MEINPQRSSQSSTIIWKLRVDFIFGKGSEKFHYALIFKFRNYSLGANVPPEIISLDALVEKEIFAEINFIKQGKLLSVINLIDIYK